MPPQLEWVHSASEDDNVKSVTLLYPAPRRYTAYGLETVGYRDHVLFPIDVVLAKAGMPLNAELSLDLLVCSSICVPKHFDLKLALPAGASKPSAEAPLLRAARDQLPTDPDNAGLLLRGVKNDGQNLTFTIASREALVQPDVFVENAKSIGFGAPKIQVDPHGHSADLTVAVVDTLPAETALAGMPLTLTFINGNDAVEIKAIAPKAVLAPPPPAPQIVSFGMALLFALIGGLILNLMPCVLPVLSMKILSVTSHGGGEASRVRHSFIITGAGIVFSFLVLAGITATLKSFGMALGWGVQFQQPFFLMFLVLILTFFSANLWDLFDIPLPRFLADRVDPSYHPKLAGDFATGAFATLLATPCSAPFLGTAVSFALGSGTEQIFLIFLMLGLGMALPYLGVALFPRLATSLPKPGIWMIHLRRLLGGALALTAVWLIWVLAAQITVVYAVGFGVFMGLVGVLLVLKKCGLRKSLITIGLLEVCVLAMMLGTTGALKPKNTAAEVDRQWLSYSPSTLRADIAEGKTVFLDVTADWCLTCKANMKFTLSQAEVAEHLFHSDVVAMQANWTNPDPAITDLLQKYGRYGIPFNAVFGPAAPEGIILPELLTSSLVLDALAKAAASSPP